MIPIDRSASACVFDTSGERFSVQLTNSAERSEKSHWSSIGALQTRGAAACYRRARPPSGAYPDGGLLDVFQPALCHKALGHAEHAVARGRVAFSDGGPFQRGDP